MMLRFVTFVDGSNLDGVLKHLNLRVDDYGAFYRHVFEQSVQYWGRTFAEGPPWPTAQHSRIYWYVVGKMDEWDLNDPKAEARLRTRFEMNPRLRDAYLEDVEPAASRPARSTAGSRRPGTSASPRPASGTRASAGPSSGRSGSTTASRPRPTSSRSARRGTGRSTCCTTRSTRRGSTPAWPSTWSRFQDTYDIALLISGDADGIPGHQLRQEPVEARRRRRVPPRLSGRFPHQGNVVAAQDRRRLRRPGLRVRPAPPQPRLSLRVGLLDPVGRHRAAVLSAGFDHDERTR